MTKLNWAVFALLLFCVLGSSNASASQDVPPKDVVLANLERGVSNIALGWTELLEHTHQEVSKGRNHGERIIGFMAGSAIGIRKGIHRIGAGAIDLLTFWIPKKAPLIAPDEDSF